MTGWPSSVTTTRAVFRHRPDSKWMDVQEAVRKVERSAKLGLRGGLIWGIPPYDKPVWNPLWTASSRHQPTVALHILTGRKGSGIGDSVMIKLPLPAPRPRAVFERYNF